MASASKPVSLALERNLSSSHSVSQRTVWSSESKDDALASGRAASHRRDTAVSANCLSTARASSG